MFLGFDKNRMKTKDGLKSCDRILPFSLDSFMIY